MGHPLEDVIRGTDGFVIIGDSSKKRFPAMSYHSYTKTNKPFYCLDLGGLTESRGPTKGGKVYTSVEEIPEDHSDLAIIWVTPSVAKTAVETAVALGCKRIWFNFKTASQEAVDFAREQGLEIVEIGRCPVYYMDRMTPACRVHTLMIKATRGYRKPPQTEIGKNREMI